MSGSSFGKNFVVTTWGQSHSDCMGVVIDGVPSGISLNEKDIKEYLHKRSATNFIHSTSRIEKDEPIILSGIFNSKTTGTPICIMIKNENQNSLDYKDISTIFRPSHADYTYYKKYENYDYRGGGRASARETICRVIAGAVANKILAQLDIKVLSYVSSIGKFNVKDLDLNFKNPLNFPDKNLYNPLISYLTKLRNKKDSIGGTIKSTILNLPSGIGEPVFNKLDALLSYSLFSIGGVKAVEIGSGVLSSKILGSKYNDQMNFDGQVNFNSNNSGGILGGISNGNTIEILTSFKPTPSIGVEQDTINTNNENTKIKIKGRHDVCYVPRANIVVTSMINIVLVDLLMQNMHSKIESLIKFYKN